MPHADSIIAICNKCHLQVWPERICPCKDQLLDSLIQRITDLERRVYGYDYATGEPLPARKAAFEFVPYSPGMTLGPGQMTGSTP